MVGEPLTKHCSLLNSPAQSMPTLPAPLCRNEQTGKSWCGQH